MSSRAGAKEGEGADEEGDACGADAEAGVEEVVVAVAVKRVGARWGGRGRKRRVERWVVGGG